MERNDRVAATAVGVAVLQGAPGSPLAGLAAQQLGEGASHAVVGVAVAGAASRAGQQLEHGEPPSDQAVPLEEAYLVCGDVFDFAEHRDVRAGFDGYACETGDFASSPRPNSAVSSEAAAPAYAAASHEHALERPRSGLTPHQRGVAHAATPSVPMQRTPGWSRQPPLRAIDAPMTPIRTGSPCSSLPTNDSVAPRWTRPISRAVGVSENLYRVDVDLVAYIDEVIENEPMNAATIIHRVTIFLAQRG